MTDTLAAVLALALVGVVTCRAVDDDRHPKVTLVRAEWLCLRHHTEVESRPIQLPDGSAGQELLTTPVCDDWSRR